MNIRMRMAGAAAAASLALLGAALSSGCEDGDSKGDLQSISGADFRISPADYTYSGTSSMYVVAFTVVGGKPPFAWSVSDPISGTVTTNITGRIVNYRPARADARAVNVITVRDSRGWTTSAAVRRRP